MPNNQEIEESAKKQDLPLRVLIGMGLSVGLVPLNSTMIAVSLPDIGSHLGVDASSLTQWLVTSYLVASLVFQSPAGKFGDLWGHQRAINIGRWLFVLGSLLGGLIALLPALIAARLLMALGGGMLMPPTMALLRNMVPEEKRGRVFGALASVLGLSAAAGPLVGGWLTDGLGWQYVFWVNVPLVLIATLLVSGVKLPVPDFGKAGRPKFDVLGSVLLATGLSVGVVALRLPGLTLVLSITALVTLTGFFLYERGVDEPVIDINIFRQPTYRAGVFITGLQNFAMYGILFQLPYLYAEIYGIGSSRVALVLMGLMGGMVLFSPLGGRLADRVGAGITIFIGSLCGLAGMWLLSLPEYWAQPNTLLPFMVLIGIGIGFSMGPAQSAALGVISKRDSGMASGAMSMMRYVGSTIGTAMLGILLANSTMPPVERYSFGFRIYSIPFIVSALLALILVKNRSKDRQSASLKKEP